jgi:hypothetical protein
MQETDHLLISSRAICIRLNRLKKGCKISSEKFLFNIKDAIPVYQIIQAVIKFDAKISVI